MTEGSTHTPKSVEVRGWRDGEVEVRHLCESEEEAIALAEQWSEQGVSRIQIDDLSAQHGGSDILGAESEIEAEEFDEREHD